MNFVYKPEGVCSKEMIITVNNNIIENVKIIGGCPGNTLGVSKLLQGMTVDEAITKLKGILCGNKKTSCPDQLSIALEHIKDKLLE